MFRSIFALCLLPLIASCASGPTEPPAPEWTKKPARVVDNGYIVYVESSLDADADKAKFKAEAAGLEDLANECSFIPKEARVEDRYDHKTEHMHESYAKVAIEFQVCDQARKTNDPDQIRKLANVPMTEEVKRYQELLGKPDAEQVAAAEIEAPEKPGTPVSHDHFFVFRERIWYAKEEVILAPREIYVAGTPARADYVKQVTLNSTAAEAYETRHPEIKSTTSPWSHYRANAVREFTVKPPPMPGMMKPSRVRSTGRGHVPKSSAQKKKKKWRTR